MTGGYGFGYVPDGFPCLKQSNPRVRKIIVRNSGAGNGGASIFWAPGKNAFFLH